MSCNAKEFIKSELFHGKKPLQVNVCSLRGEEHIPKKEEQNAENRDRNQVDP